MGPSIGVVVPAYDPDVGRLVDYVESLLALEPDAIRIELDAPSAATRDALTDVPATVNVVSRRRGKGAALTAGFEALETDVYAFVDADGSTPVESLRRVLAPVVDGDADVAVGSRRHPDATVRASQSPVRERLGDEFAGLARLLLPITLYDYQCGAKVLTADAWETVRDDIFEAGFGWDVELLAAAARHGFTVEEVPIEWEDAAGSTVDPLRALPSFLRALVRGASGGAIGWPRQRPLRSRLAEGE